VQPIAPAEPLAIKPLDVIVRAMAWGELFVLVPLHAFWILFRVTPFVAENTASALVAAGPLGVMLAVALAAQLPVFRAAVARLEWLFHLTAALCLSILLFYIVLRDPFSPGLPITWPLCFWSVGLAFLGLANLATHERLRGRRAAGSKSPWPVAVGTAFALWGMLVWLAAGMAWAPYFLTASIAFHAVMAMVSRRWGRGAATRVIVRGGRAASVTALAEALALAALMLTAMLRLLFACEMIGTAELKYFQFVGLATSPWFLGGAALALVAARFRFAFATHGAAVAAILFSPEAATWSIPLTVGYALPSLFIASTRQGALAYTLSLAAAIAPWALGLLGFMVAGVIVLFEMGLGFAQGLLTQVRVLTIVLYAVWIALAGANLWWSRRRPAPEAGITALGPLPAVVYVGVWAALLGFIAYWSTATMWPPVVFERAARVEVGEPSGVCHAGYSRSEEEYADLDRLGVRLMRVDFHWTRVQPEPDTWDFDRYDAYLDAAEAHNINVLALLVFDNDAVEQSPKGSKQDRYIAPEDLPLFLEYVRRTVGRYKDRVYAWEMWNEPDIARFWTGTMDELYELARRTADTVREVCPEARLLGPAMTSPLGVHSAEGIEGLHQSGALARVDHPTMHTYISHPRAYYNEFYRVRNAAAKHGHPGSVWVTELGDPDGGVYPWRASSGLLAEHVMKAYTIATSVGVEKLVWYCYRDSSLASQSKAPNNSEGFFGLVGPGGEWKPAAHAYRLFAKHCSDSAIRSDLVHASGGLAARQLRTALYRRDDGASTLVMWFEPALRPGAHARVRIGLGALDQPAVTHDVTSGYTKHLLDPVVDVTETPLFITFNAPSAETPVHLQADTSPADAAWLLLVVLLVLVSAWRSIRGPLSCQD